MTGVDRLRARDLALLAAEDETGPSHDAALEIFEPGDNALTYTSLVALIEDRLAFVPRYRQRLADVPGRLANPVWVDDADFDLSYHVRRSALPRPGSDEQLRDLVGRIISRPLDRERPLWEVYFIEGLAEGRVAILSKSHPVLVDGVQTVALGQVLLDTGREYTLDDREGWRAEPTPTAAGLVWGAVKDSVERPLTVFETASANAGAALRQAAAVAGRAGSLAGALTARGSAPATPINLRLSHQRLFVGVRTDLADYRAIRGPQGGTVNDVVLATITGGLRSWLMARGESLGGVRQLRALVPMSVIDDDLEATSLGSQLAGHLVELPISEPSPVVRLHQVSYSFKTHGETRRTVAANRLAGIAGFAPATFHVLGSRLIAAENGQHFNLGVTNVPGPQFPLYAAGGRMEQTYPVPPLPPGHALAIGVTSYDGAVYYGLTGDRTAVPDLDLLGTCLTESLEELLDSAGPDRSRAPRGRGSRGSRGGDRKATRKVTRSTR